MKKYTTTAVLWRHGIEMPVGSTLTLSDADAKYLKHALQPEKAKTQTPTPADEPTPEPDAEPESDEPTVLGATTEEHPIERQNRRRRRSGQ